jgi:hypothetical protein
MSSSEAYFSAEEILQQALERLKTERDSQFEYISDLEDQLTTARILHAEASVATEVVEKLLAGELYALNGPIRAAAYQTPPTSPPPEPDPVFIDWSEAAAQAELPGVFLDVIKAMKPAVEPASSPAPTPAPEPGPRQSLTFDERKRDLGKVDAFQREDDARFMVAIEKLSEGSGQAQVSLSVLAKASSIPKGSLLFVARRLAAAGRIEIIPAGEGRGVKKPNTYRLIGARPRQPLADLPYEPPIQRERRATPVPDASLPACPAAAPHAAPAPSVQFDHLEDASSDAPAGSLLALKVGDCRWPLDDHPPGEMDHTTFCGRSALNDSSYCAEHEAKFHGGSR